MTHKKTILTVCLAAALAAAPAFASPKKAAKPMAAPSHGEESHSGGGPGSYGVSGCGLGTYVFKDHSSKVQMVLAATTNGTSGNQTFGISTGTSNCEIEGGKWARFTEQDSFVAANYDQLSRDAASGGGESLTAMTQLMGCAPTAAARLGTVAQQNYNAIFAGTTSKSAPTVVRNMKTVIAQDSLLASACGHAAL